MALDGLSLTEIDDETAKSVEKDQTARVCRPITGNRTRKKSLYKDKILNLSELKLFTGDLTEYYSIHE